jgi:hypothetical protein
MLTTLAQAWASHNSSWLQQVFDSWDSVSLQVQRDEQEHCVGYRYVLQNAVLKTRLGSAAVIPPTVPGAICGDHGGTTKSGGSCKNPGKNVGNRCYAHALPLHAVACPVGTRLAEVVIDPGEPDNKLRGPVPWDRLSFNETHQAIDFVNTPPLAFKSAYMVMNSFINVWQDQWGPVLNYNVICQHGSIRASSHWPIERLRSQLKYNGPWRTTRGEQVALQGSLLGDYTPGIWM